MRSSITKKLPEAQQVIDKKDELISAQPIKPQEASIDRQNKLNGPVLVPFKKMEKRISSSGSYNFEGVKRLDRRDIEKAAGIITKAFMDYPLPGQFIKDIDRRKKALMEMFKVELRKALHEGSVYTLGGDFQEVAVWKHEVKPESDFIYIKYLRLSTFKLLFYVRFNEWIRLFKALRNILKTKNQLGLPANTVELYIVGVNPAYQGEGRLSKLLKPILKEKQGQGRPVLVMTNTDSNRKIYEHLGFSLVEVLDDQDNDIRAYYLVK